ALSAVVRRFDRGVSGTAENPPGRRDADRNDAADRLDRLACWLRVRICTVQGDAQDHGSLSQRNACTPARQAFQTIAVRHECGLRPWCPVTSSLCLPGCCDEAHAPATPALRLRPLEDRCRSR